MPHSWIGVEKKGALETKGKKMLPRYISTMVKYKEFLFAVYFSSQPISSLCHLTPPTICILLQLCLHNVSGIYFMCLIFKLKNIFPFFFKLCLHYFLDDSIIFCDACFQFPILVLTGIPCILPSKNSPVLTQFNFFSQFSDSLLQSSKH